MRGLTKAAALLSSTVAQALVVPEPASSAGVGSSKPVVEYRTSLIVRYLETIKYQRVHRCL